MKQVCLCIHGHFYQPPRENAWIEDVERQDSASPYHDWNERIYAECYSPNTRARVYDRHGQIIDLVNNFEKISFNVGPTLMSWLEVKHPQTYRKIIDADQKSRTAHKGHGNAIAQIYNHMIMPLASPRDKKTQVRWGTEDFKSRFGRAPEGMWLPETACNEETLEALVEEGIQFTILAPCQAEAVRVFGGDWKDVSNSEIDPRRAYRYFLKKHPSKFIDIFFYDGPISKSVGFEDLLKDAKIFMERIDNAVVDYGEHSQLIHMATDGETYGHHKPYGDRVIAYLMNVKAPQKGYRIVNYAEFLEENPPIFEVRLKEGENGEGTAWSCPHGLRRWKEHCGCRGGGPLEWTQHWRKPLRESLDWLRDEIGKVYENYASPFLKDIWQVRDDYIQVILNRQKENIENFLNRYRYRELTSREVTTCLKLLEMQRYAMLMYTSCGWFFTEISGIETLQILQYAARAIQLAQEVSGVALEEEFLNRLSRAKSNIEALKDGRGVYESLVKPSIATLENIVASYAVGSIFEGYYPPGENLDLYCFNLQLFYHHKDSSGNLTVNFGRAKIASRMTLEEKDLVFTVFQIGHYDFHCSIKPFSDETDLDRLEEELFEGLYRSDILDLLKKIDAAPKENHLTLKDLLLEDRVKIITLLTKEQIEKVSKFYERIYDESHRMNFIYRSINLPIPAEFRYAAERVLSNRLMEVVQKMGGQDFSLRKASVASRILDTAKLFGIEIQKAPLNKFLSEEMDRRIEKFVETPTPELIRECINIHKLSEKFEIYLDAWRGQDHLFLLLRKWQHDPSSIPEAIASSATQLFQLVGRFQIAHEELKKLIGKPAV